MATILAELAYPIIREMWRQQTEAFPFLRAVESMAGQHDVHLLAVEEGPDVRESCGFDPDGFQAVREERWQGVTYHFTTGTGEWPAIVGRIRPHLAFFNSWPDAAARLFPALPPGCIRVGRCHHEVRRELTIVQSRHYYRNCHWLIPPFDSDVAALRAASVSTPAMPIPFGVNTSRFSPFAAVERDIVVATSAKNTWKGRDIAEALFSGPLAGHACENIIWQPQWDVVQKLRRTQIFFYASASEGFTRILSEAAAAGCLIVVPEEIPCLVEHARLLGGRTIPTGCRIVPDGGQCVKPVFDRPLHEVTDDLLTLRSAVTGRPPATIGHVDAQLEIFRTATVLQSILDHP